jgi:hypothetical protein
VKFLFILVLTPHSLPPPSLAPQGERGSQQPYVAARFWWPRPGRGVIGDLMKIGDSCIRFARFSASLLASGAVPGIQAASGPVQPSVVRVDKSDALGSKHLQLGLNSGHRRPSPGAARERVTSSGRTCTAHGPVQARPTSRGQIGLFCSPLARRGERGWGRVGSKKYLENRSCLNQSGMAATLALT